jgi:hypothetical protein
MVVCGDDVTTGIQQCVQMVGTKIRDGSSLQSFKGGANWFPESMVMM